MGRRKLEPLGRVPDLQEVWWGTRSRIAVDENGCWIWQGARFRGYGPHLRLYRRYVGDVPKGFDLHHACLNGSGGCVNPAHLEVVDMNEHRTENAQRVLGKLTVESAKEIRRLLVESDLSMEAIGERFGVSTRLVLDISRGRTWRQAGDTELHFTRTCPYCGVTFSVRNRRVRYCSKTHARAYNNRWDVIKARKVAA